MYRKLRSRKKKPEWTGETRDRPVNQGAPNGTTELFPEVSSRDFLKIKLLILTDTVFPLNNVRGH